MKLKIEKRHSSKKDTDYYVLILVNKDGKETFLTFLKEITILNIINCAPSQLDELIKVGEPYYIVK